MRVCLVLKVLLLGAGRAALGLLRGYCRQRLILALIARSEA